MCELTDPSAASQVTKPARSLVHQDFALHPWNMAESASTVLFLELSSRRSQSFVRWDGDLYDAQDTVR